MSVRYLCTVLQWLERKGEAPLLNAQREIPRSAFEPDRGSSLIRKRTPLGPYCRPMPRVIGGS